MSPKELPTEDQGYIKISEVPVDQFKGVISQPTIQKLISFEELLLERGEQGLVDWLRNNARNGITPLAREIGLNNKTLGKFYDHLGIPRPSLDEIRRTMWQERWQDPEFVQRHAEWSRRSLQKRWQDESFRKRQSESTRKMWDDPEFRVKKSEWLRRQRLDPTFNEKMSRALIEARQNPSYKEGVSKRSRAMWDDPEFREQQLTMMQNIYQDPSWREKHLEGVRRSMQDLEWRGRRAEAVRQARHDPTRIGRYKVPTIQGVRRDIGYHAFSAWEANIARVLMYCERDFYTQEGFNLMVPQEYQDLFPIKNTEITLDFITLDPRGNFLAYELMAHPLENPVGWAKLELLIDQYPMLQVRPIIPKFYNAIQRHFQRRINEDPRFCGWETSKDSLRNNPTKYS